ncbi:MAG: heavy-metal-associated domain-containing protein [Cyclobacteriaceae bacterium]
MKKLTYKTNINCGGCIQSVTPFLNEVDDIDSWKVDTDNPDKILTIEGEEDLSSKEIIDTVIKAGFMIEEIA